MKLPYILDWKKEKGLSHGVYKYDGKGEFKGHRFHLRVDKKQDGALLVDASKIISLNGTALDYARCALEGKSEDDMYRYMRSRYRKLDRKKAVEHYDDTKKQLLEVISGKMMAIKTVAPSTPTIGSDNLAAPYRMDLALTYRCQNACSHCYNETKDKKELTVDEWKKVLDILWNEGIPHVVFTGGEPTLYEGIKDLIIKSEELGQVTGLITNGRNLREPGYLHELVKVGLDHVQITLLSYRESVHDKLTGQEGSWKETVAGIKTALQEEMYVSTNTTIMRTTIGDVEETMRFLVSLGVKNIAFNSIIRAGSGKNVEGITFAELSATLAKLKSIAQESGTNLIWYAPTPYCEFNPVNEGFGIKQCTACSINMAIEPDGTVIPCQSCYEPLGNILKDPWKNIWDHKTCRRIRERKYVPEKCSDCALLDTCGGGCPLSIEHGDYLCLDRHSNP